MARRSNKSFAHIEGLQDFLKDMGVMKSEMQRAERVFQTIAAATVISTAKSFAASEGKQQQLAATTLTQTGQSQGTVSYGGLPFAMGAEFGAIQYKQFLNWRGNQEGAGYFFWPAIRNFRDDDMLNLWVREVWTVVEDLFGN